MARPTLLLAYQDEDAFFRDEKALQMLEQDPMVRRVHGANELIERVRLEDPALVIIEREFDKDAACTRALLEEGVAVLFIVNNPTDPMRREAMALGAFELVREGLADLVALHVQNILRTRSLASNLDAVERQLRALVQNSNDAVYILRGSNFIFANPRFEELMGYNLREILDNEFDIERNIIAPESRPILLERQARLREGLPIEPRYEFVALRKSGELFDAQVSVSYITFQGEPATLGIISDITARKQFEKMLLRKNRELALINDLTKSINRAVELEQTLVVGCRKAARLLNANAVGISLLSQDRSTLELRIQEGLSDAAIKHMSRLPLNENSLLAHTAESGNVQLVHDLHSDARVTISAVRDENFKGAIVVPLKAEDRLLGVAFFLTPPGVKLYEEESELLMSLGHLLGTSIHKAELLDHARSAYGRLRAVDEIALTIMSSLEPDDVATKVAHRISKMFGCERIVIARWFEKASVFVPMLGMQNNERFDGRALGRGETLMGHLLDTGEPAQCVHPSAQYAQTNAFDPPPYEEMLFEEGYGAAIALPIMGESRTLGALHLAFRESVPLSDSEIDALITLSTHLAIAIRNAELFESRETTMRELKSAQERLVQSERLNALGELAAGVAHDFNNVLGAISGRAQLLAKKLDDEGLRKHALVIEKAAQDGAETVRRVQELGRQETTDDFVDVDSSEICRDVYEFTMPKWRTHAQNEGRDVEVRLELGDGFLARGNPHELREVLVNLVHNAVDALPSGGEIVLGARAEKNDDVFFVRDNGTGIPPDVRARIFDPFFTTKGDKGTGLGLSVSYSIIKRHGGELVVDDNPEGQGTCFAIRLPRQNDTSQDFAPPRAANENRLVLPESCARVLVIDDEENIRDILNDILESGEHEVVLAEDGPTALLELDRAAFDLVLTDLGLPGMNGFEVTAEIKKRYPRVPVGLVTGWGARVDEEEAENAGIRFILSKPFRFEQVLEVVDEALAMRVVS